MRGSYGAGRRMAALCAVLMGVFALMTVLVLAGSGSKTRLEGSLGYPEAGPLPDMVAPGSTPASGAHGAKHATPSKSGAAGSLETVGAGTATLAGASSITGSGGTTGAGNSGARNGTSSTGKSSTGKGSVQTGGGKTTGSGGKTGGSGGGKGSGGGTTPGKPGGSTGGSGGSTGEIGRLSPWWFDWWLGRFERRVRWFWWFWAGVLAVLAVRRAGPVGPVARPGARRVDTPGRARTAPSS